MIQERLFAPDSMSISTVSDAYTCGYTNPKCSFTSAALVVGTLEFHLVLDLSARFEPHRLEQVLILFRCCPYYEQLAFRLDAGLSIVYKCLSSRQMLFAFSSQLKRITVPTSNTVNAECRSGPLRLALAAS